jgi:hypothetical protein
MDRACARPRRPGIRRAPQEPLGDGAGRGAPGAAATRCCYSMPCSRA